MRTTNLNQLPQENIKRGSVRPQDRNSFDTAGMIAVGLDSEDSIAWLSNKHNEAYGWTILKASDEIKKEFGQDVYRSYNEHRKTANIVKINLEKGTFAFLNNEAYEEGIIKFEKMTPYKQILIDPVDKAFDEFNIV